MTVHAVNRWLALGANVGVLVGIAFLIVEINQNTQVTDSACRDAYDASCLTSKGSSSCGAWLRQILS